MLALCLQAVLISSPCTWDWTRMHALAVMHWRTLCENVDSAKIKLPFYKTDIDILRVASMHRIVTHRIDISINPYRWIVTPLWLTLSTGVPLIMSVGPLLSLPEVHNQLFSFAHIQRETFVMAPWCKSLYLSTDRAIIHKRNFITFTAWVEQYHTPWSKKKERVFYLPFVTCYTAED